MYRVTKLRWRRRVRHSRRQVEDIGNQAEQHFDKHFIRRLIRLGGVRRFVIGWLLLLVMLGGIVVVQTRALTGYYQQLQPVVGGAYNEGLVGSFTNSNPLFASSMADTTVSKLVFSGLLTYDVKNQLVNDLAESWKIDETGTLYTVVLRPGTKWHDGRDLTADDVVFTFKQAQNPDVKSPLFQSWREVTIKKVDDRTVTFSLKAPFAPFIYSLTTGIIPKHLLETVEPTQLRSVSFNTSKPIGAGPFKWDALEITGGNVDDREQQIGLIANPQYHLGRPKLDRFVVKTFISKDKLQQAFAERRVDAVVGLEQLPDDFDKTGIVYNETPLTAIQMAFFLSDTGPLKDGRVRSALVQAADTAAIIKALGFPVVKSDEPFLRTSFAYDPAYRQLGKNIEQSNKLLTDAGWLRTGQEVRKQAKDSLTINILGLQNQENSSTARALQQAWASVGVKAEVNLQNERELRESITNRAYDVLLNAISLGADPDVYAFWHSSQADPRSQSRLNFSNYSSKSADSALDGGRTRVDSALRSAKYKPFLQAWKDDNPALAMYQPRFLYLTRGTLFNYEPKVLNSSTDRLNNVHEWMVRQSNVPIPK